MKYGKIISRIRTGSHLYGLNTPKSDEDFVGVFIPTAESLLGLKKVEVVDQSTKKSSSTSRNTAEDIDEKYYALPKFLHLLLQNNPNIIELLFANEKNILISSDIWEELVSNVDKIISQKIYHTFKGYAFSQKKKLMIKSERYKSLEEGIQIIDELAFEDAYEMFENNYTKKELLDKVTKDPKGFYWREITENEAELLNSRLKYYKGKKQNCESFHKGMSLGMIYSKILHEYNNYGWRVKTDTFETLHYDCKFGYHLIRILVECYELLKNRALSYPISGQAREDIIRIREGKVEIKELLSLYDKYEKLCDEAYKNTTLPNKPNFNWANHWIIKILKTYIVSST